MLARLGALRRGLGPELGAAFDELAGRLRLFEGRAGQGYFSHPMALPTLDLPRWAAAHLALRGAEAPPARVLRLAEAAAVGYLRVRVEDDWLDEGIGEPGAVMMLAGALGARHEALIAAELPRGSAFWDLFEEVWRGYAEAMLLERRLQRGEGDYDEAAFRRVLARSRPLVLPAAAALFAAGRIEGLAAVEQLVDGLAAGHQLFADALHAQKDSALGVTTHALRRLGVERGAGGAEVAQALLLRGGLDALVDAARAELERARTAARALGAEEAERFLEERVRYMADLRARAFQALFQGGP